MDSFCPKTNQISSVAINFGWPSMGMMSYSFMFFCEEMRCRSMHVNHRECLLLLIPAARILLHWFLRGGAL